MVLLIYRNELYWYLWKQFNELSIIWSKKPNIEYSDLNKPDILLKVGIEAEGIKLGDNITISKGSNQEKVRSCLYSW